MQRPGERLRALTGGALSLAGILLFAGLATGALLLAGIGGKTSPVFDPYILRVLRFTLIQAFLSSALSVALAIPFARALARQPRFPGRIWIIRMLGIPLGLPVIVGALGLIAVWGRNGWANGLAIAMGLQNPISIYGLAGILLAHVFFNFPLATRLFLAGLERLPGEYWLITGNLGMKPSNIFRFIEWPQLKRQIPGIAGLIFMLAATSFTLVLLLGGGPAATTLEVAIYQALRFDFDPPRAVSLSLMQMALTGAVLFGLSFLRTELAEGVTHGMPRQRPDGRGALARAIDFLLIAIGMLFVALPLASIVTGGLKADLAKLVLDPMVQRAAITSLAIAIPSGLIALGLSWLLAEARLAIVLSPRATALGLRYANSLPALSSLILLVPPTVLGTGWFLLVGPARLEPAAPLLIIVINGLMALPFVLRVLDPALSTHRSRTARLCASLGISGWNRLRFIDWPALKRPLATALSFAMALSLGDLGVIALFGSEKIMTLPWLLYSRMGSYRTEDAAGLALMLALFCLLLTFSGTSTPSSMRSGEKDG